MQAASCWISKQPDIRLYIIWFHLYGILENRIIVKENRLVVEGEREGRREPGITVRRIWGKFPGWWKRNVVIMHTLENTFIKFLYLLSFTEYTLYFNFLKYHGTINYIYKRYPYPFLVFIPSIILQRCIAHPFLVKKKQFLKLFDSSKRLPHQQVVTNWPYQSDLFLPRLV